eukprot:TRINITY_DN12612_c0_g1_i1.p1 TRINITY_DN12612_c0_g1~~TRINITY_DN12612_c0_g1_i1.p1  ORF type:complete len:1512 (+),score=329.51 TRINITY_DN12612_c0_g1_i1:135-4670(+)
MQLCIDRDGAPSQAGRASPKQHLRPPPNQEEQALALLKAEATVRHKEIAALRDELREEFAQKLAQVEETLQGEIEKWIDYANKQMTAQAAIVSEIKHLAQGMQEAATASAASAPAATPAESPAKPVMKPVQPVQAEVLGAAPEANQEQPPAPILAPEEIAGVVANVVDKHTGQKYEEMKAGLTLHLEEQMKATQNQLLELHRKYTDSEERTSALEAEVKKTAAPTADALPMEVAALGDDAAAAAEPAAAPPNQARKVVDLLLPIENPLRGDIEQVERRLTDLELKVLEVAKPLELLASASPLESSLQKDSQAVQDAPVKAFELDIDGAKIEDKSSAGAGTAQPQEEPPADGEAAGDSWIELQRDMLDTGNMYNVSESIWDSLLFAFTGYCKFDVSVAVILVYMLNVMVQATFIYTVWVYMLPDPVAPDVLMALLKFRAGIAHDVNYADRTNMRSMTQQICDEDSKLHLSGIQAGLFSDVKQFYDGAATLVILAQLTWTVTIFSDLQNTYRFVCTLLSIKRGPKTKIMCDCESMANDADPSLVSTKVVLKLTTISLPRMIILFIFVVIPRIVIAIVLCYVGTKYLGVTVNMGDLLLNAMALAFIIDLDELFFNIFAPRHVQLLVENMEPTPILPSARFRKLPGFATFMKLMMVAGYLVAVWYLIVSPFFTELKQAQDLLCSGNRDFVVAQNLNTGMVYATKSKEDQMITNAEKGVLQLTGLHFNEKSNWVKALKKEDPELVQTVTRNMTYATIFSTQKPAPEQISEATYSAELFMFLTGLPTMTVKESLFLPCRDLEAAPNPEAAMTMLRTALGQDDIPLCSETNATAKAFWQPHCSNMSLNLVRTLCPRTCECDQPIALVLGAYQHPEFGCPTQCASLRSSMETYESKNAATSDTCADYPPGAFSMTSDDFNMAQWFKDYIRTVRDYLMSRQGYAANVEYNAGVYAGIYSTRVKNVTETELTGYLLDSGQNGFWENLGNRVWGVLPGYAGIFGDVLEGCAFLTSPDFKWLFSHDVCDQSQHLSLRYICPESCGCGTMEGCPTGCRLNEDVVPCADNVHKNKEVVPTTLSHLLGNSSITECADILPEVLSQQCWRREMKLLRRYCPSACGCGSVGEYQQAVFFGDGAFGCPRSCRSLYAATIEFMDVEYSVPCVDRQNWFWFDGGTGQQYKRRYLEGMLQYLQAKGTAFYDMVYRGVHQMVASLGGAIPADEIPSTAAYVAYAEWLPKVLKGVYRLIPSVPMMKKEGGFVDNFCAFLAHYTFRLLLGLDVCADGEFQSIRYMCPRACSCVSQFGCPISCAGKAPVAAIAVENPAGVIQFQLTLETSATCADMTEGSGFEKAMKATGAALVGKSSVDAVTVTCGSGRRLVASLRRLAALPFSFKIPIERADIEAARSALTEATAASVQQVLNKAVEDAEASMTFTVDEAAIAAMKDSVEAGPSAGVDGGDKDAAEDGEQSTDENTTAAATDDEGSKDEASEETPVDQEAGEPSNDGGSKEKDGEDEQAGAGED